MRGTFFCNKYLIFLLFLFSPMIINIGGEVSPTLLFIAATSPFWIKNIDIKNDTLLRNYSLLFFIILLVQIAWFPFAKTDDLTQLKGILITVSGLMHFLYYYFVFKRNTSVIKWAILGTFISKFIFVNVLAEIAGGEYGLWKFHTYPHIVEGCVLIYLWGCEKKWIFKIAPLLLILVGILGIITGARSSGLTPLAAGFFASIILFRKQKIQIKKIIKYVIVAIVALYSAYALLYVPNVLNGNIQGGNTLQLKRTENPYNPINLLMIGRTDAIIPFMAFFDKPLTGWGYMTKDPNKKYYRLLLKIGNKEKNNRQKDYIEHNIPAHSAWGYYSCSYGILVFIVLFLMLFKTWKYVLLSIVSQDKYLLYRIWCIMTITWNLLFSPIAHFKWSIPSTIAIVVVLSTSAIKEYIKNRSLNNESKNISNNANNR